MGREGVGKWGGVMGKDFCPNILQPFLENIARGKPGANFSISQPSPKMLTLSFGGGSHHEVPYRSGLLCHFDEKRFWIYIQNARKYLEGGN